jgi:hypothetical protein
MLKFIFGTAVGVATTATTVACAKLGYHLDGSVAGALTGLGGLTGSTYAAKGLLKLTGMQHNIAHNINLDGSKHVYGVITGVGIALGLAFSSESIAQTNTSPTELPNQIERSIIQTPTAHP